MKILFMVLPSFNRFKTRIGQVPFVAIPYGILSMITYCKDMAEFKIIDCDLDYDNYLNILKKELSEFKPDVIGISLMFDVSYSHLPVIMNTIKEYDTTTHIILGGVGASANYKELLLENKDIEAICYGEGEKPLKDFILTGKFNKSWATRDNLCPEKDLLLDLDDTVNMDFSYIDLTAYENSISESYSPDMHGKDGKKQFYLITSRGCPFSCCFCYNSLNPDKRIRYASVDSIINRVDFLVEEYGMNVLTFYDDQILFNRERALELFNRLEKYGLRVELTNGISPAYLNDDIALAMRKAGVDSLHLALESGSHEILKLMKKPVNLNKLKDTMNMLRKYNFFISVFIVIGIPGETDKHREESEKYIREIDPDIVMVKVASPTYGSKLRQDCIEKGYIKNTKFGELDFLEAVIETPECSSEYLKEYTMYMNWYFNFVNNRRMRIGDYKAARHYFEHTAKKYPHELFAEYFAIKANEKLGIIDGPRMNSLKEKMTDDYKGYFNYFGVNI